jgi:hypothetical protein
MAHACGAYSVEGFLHGKGPVALALWDRLVERTRRCGGFEFAPAKTRVAFMVRVRFLAVTALSERGMTFHLWLREPLDSPRFFRVDHLGPRAYIHWTRVRAPEEIDDELEGAICASYRVGCGDA